MKKSRIAKFALLGASAAALAATLSTSTYAWYVSNKKANVNNGSGATGSAGSDGSVLVAWQDADNKYFKEIDFANAVTKTTNALQPIHKHTDGKFYGIANDGYSRSTTESTAYISFDVYVKTGNGGDVTPKFNITTSKKDTNNGQVAWVADGLPTSKLTTNGQVDNSGSVPSAGSTFYVDAKYAMYVEQKVDGGATTYYELDSTETGGNAHTFYYSVQGWWNASEETTTHELWAVAPVSASGLGVIPTTANTGKKVTYTIFLDGGDLDCFNACELWDITFSVEFSIQ